MVWSNEETLEFLELYKRERLLWDPHHPQNKNRNAVQDGWKRIETEFSLETTIDELKRKKESLMSSYRSVCNKIKASYRSGAAPNEVYKTTWFAFGMMNSFLHGLYNNVNSENYEETTEDFDDDFQSRSTTPDSVLQITKPIGRKRNFSQVERSVKYIENASKPGKDSAEVDLFCQLLAIKLKKFSESQRENIMDNIEMLLIKEKRNLSTTSSSHLLPEEEELDSKSDPLCINLER